MPPDGPGQSADRNHGCPSGDDILPRPDPQHSGTDAILFQDPVHSVFDRLDRLDTEHSQTPDDSRPDGAGMFADATGEDEPIEPRQCRRGGSDTGGCSVDE
jgi:hypothetical protein